MLDETGRELTEKELLKEALELMSDVCCLLFETESTQGHACAFMADSLIKYMQVVYRDDDVLRAACNYEEYENEVCNRKIPHLEIVK